MSLPPFVFSSPTLFLNADKIVVIVTDSPFIEQAEEPTIYLFLYGFLWSFGICYKVGKSSFASLNELFIDDTTDLWFAQISSLSRLVFYT